MELNFDFDDPKPNQEHAEAEVVEITPFDQFDLTRVEKEDSFLTIKQKIGEMESKAVDLKVTDDSTFKTAMEMLVQLRSLEKMADDFKKNHSLFKKIAQFKNGFDRLIRENIKNTTHKISEILSPKIGFYQKTQAEIQRRKAQKEAEEAAKKAREEAESLAKQQREREEADRQAAIDLQAKLNLEADDAGVERVSVPIPEVSNEPIVPIIPDTTVVTQKSEKIVIDGGSAKIEAVWVCKIIDTITVPRQYCMPDQKLLDRAVESGIREIPGCLIEESFDPKVRLSKKRIDKELDFKF